MAPRQRKTVGGARIPRVSNNKSMAVGVASVAAPTVVGSVVNYSVLPTQSGQPQKNTIYTSASTWSSNTGIRIAGSDIVAGTIGFSGNTGQYGLAQNLGALAGISSMWTTFTPQGVSPRLLQFEEMYTFYAFRSMLVQYIPSIASSAANGTVVCSLAMGQSYDVSTDITDGKYGLQNVAQVNPSMTFSAWEPASMQFNFTGEKLWETIDTGDQDDYVQYVMLAAAATAGGASVVPFGLIRITYEIDFYIPSFNNNDPAYQLTTGVDRIFSALSAILPSDEKSEDGKLQEILISYLSTKFRDSRKSRSKKPLLVSHREAFLRRVLLVILPPVVKQFRVKARDNYVALAEEVE